MKNVIIVPNADKDSSLAVTSAIVKKLSELGIKAYVKEKYAMCGATVCNEFPKDSELVIVVGGDGSVIDASRYAIDLGIPLVGVNLGKVGYLSEIDPGSLDVLDALASGDYYVTDKMLLTVHCDGVESGIYAVNDVVISHSDCMGISTFVLSDSLGNSLGYRADGIIFATPQGSTAYSFSSGGPVVAHDVESILVTPVCAHSFFNRSVLFNASEVLSVLNNGSRDLNVSIDGRVTGVLAPDKECKIVKADKGLKMLTFSKNSMFTGLFKKMSILEGFK